MYWIEETNDVTNVAFLNNSQIVDNILYMERKYEYFYCRELRKLEKAKADAIIRNLDEFEKASKQYHKLKSMSPELWFENWEAYKVVVDEARKRNIEIPQQVQNQANLICFG